MEKMTNAEITLKLANGQLTIAAAPDAIIGANYTDTNTAMNTAMEHASAIIAGVMHTVGDENTRPKMGAIVHATQVSPFHLHCVIQKPSAPAAKGKFFTQEGGLYIGVDNSDGNAWTEEFSDRQQLFLWFADQPCRNAHGTPLNQ